VRFEELLAAVGDEPLFETGLLLAGDVDANDVRRQLSRWTAAGKVWQVRRGLYAVAPPYQRVVAHPFVVANHIARGSYVSLQAALGFHGLIPEAVPVTTSVTMGRGGKWATPLGVFQFRHVQSELFYGYRAVEVASAQRAFVARPEKALLDLVHLEPGGDTPEYLDGLRLQHLDRLDLSVLDELAGRFDSPKLRRAAAQITEMAMHEVREYAPV
jgi:predicted transcriptional regulator of viral defense system